MDSKRESTTDAPDAPIEAAEEAGSRKASTEAGSESSKNHLQGVTETAAATAAKAKESAKYFGSFLYNVANKAGQTVTATASKLKQTLESTSILSDFTKEQQDFIKEHGGNVEVGEPPWKGCENEEEVKEQILSLSQDKRNFVRSPPQGVEFEYDPDTYNPIALALLKEDPNLGKMRFEIVPKLVKEEDFWKNYFYRVSLIKQSTNLKNLNKKGGWSSSRSSSGEGPDDPNDGSPTDRADPEFVSDSFAGADANQVSTDDIRTGMKEMGLDRQQSAGRDDKNWEDELTKDLQEFEVVAGDAINTIDEQELEKELEQMEGYKK